MHEKTRYIGHFGGNEALTELISMQTAEYSAADRTALSRTDLTLSSLVNLTFSKKRKKKTSPLYGQCALNSKLQLKPGFLIQGHKFRVFRFPPLSLG